ncbi:(2Fe-2S)-binding protein [Edaphobacter flagellatus]|uniref:(2Fe-2S)-binding protein n=1 Tax=Edaphobacter flagellatus TaxID=1933044 RepID=UPI0021B3201B|nr:(2Fe-2S)-binding protein [Edaphobacter flagellatus]
MADKLTVNLNGHDRAISSPPETPLLYVLRNECHLTGPRYGCGLAQCGACAVLLDGAEIRSCITPLAAVAGKKVTTIEGLSALWTQSKGLPANTDTLHPVQQAWIEEQVPQCGYCQSGMMIAAADLLATNPAPTVAEIKNAYTNKPPSPHLCRCGTYAAIIRAVQRASAAMKT